MEHTVARDRSQRCAFAQIRASLIVELVRIEAICSNIALYMRIVTVS